MLCGEAMDVVEVTPHVVPLLTAIVAAAAAMGGASLTRRSQREASKVQVLDITVQHLADRVEALEKSIAVAEARRDEAVEAEREAHAVKWIAIDYAGLIRRWARRFTNDEPPAAPPEIGAYL